MSRLLFGHAHIVMPWLAAKVGVSLSPESLAIGILDRGGALKGAFLVDWENHHTLELSIYSEGVITPGIARDIFEYVFLEMGAARLQVRTSRHNRAVRRVVPRMGFKFEGKARAFYGPGDDALVFGMTPDECRWINGQALRRRQQSSGAH